MNVDIPYSFYGGNRAALLCHDPEVILAGPAETGKTLALLYKLHVAAYKYPGAQMAIVRKRKTDITGSVYHTLKRDLLGDYGPGVRQYGGGYPQWVDYPTGSRIWIGGMDDPGKTLSAERDIIYVNQAEELSLSDWEYLTRPVTGRGAVMPYTQLIGDCNPAHPTHWILSRTKAGKLARFDSTHRDNPTLWDHESARWTEQGKRSLERLRNLSGVRLQRLYHGLWAAPEGAIYDVFDEDKHLVAAFEIPRHWPRFVGIDPFGAYVAAVWLALDPDSGVLNVYREYYEPFGLTTPGHVRAILEATQGEPVACWVGGGPSERQARADFAGAGLPLTEPPISDVWAGIDRVYQCLKDFALVIHKESCPQIVSEVGAYRRKVRDGQATQAIEDKESFHLLDALRYIVAWLLEPREAAGWVYRPKRIGY